MQISYLTMLIKSIYNVFYMSVNVCFENYERHAINQMLSLFYKKKKTYVMFRHQVLMITYYRAELYEFTNMLICKTVLHLLLS